MSIIAQLHYTVLYILFMNFHVEEHWNHAGRTHVVPVDRCFHVLCFFHIHHILSPVKEKVKQNNYWWLSLTCLFISSLGWVYRHHSSRTHAVHQVMIPCYTLFRMIRKDRTQNFDNLIHIFSVFNILIWGMFTTNLFCIAESPLLLLVLFMVNCAIYRYHSCRTPKVCCGLIHTGIGVWKSIREHSIQKIQHLFHTFQF